MEASDEEGQEGYEGEEENREELQLYEATVRFLRKVDCTEERPLAVNEKVQAMVGLLEGNGNKERKPELILHEGKPTRGERRVEQGG